MRQIENGETVECHIMILEADACHDARANQSPPTAFLTASPSSPQSPIQGETQRTSFPPASDSPPFLLLSPSLSDNGRVMRQL
jgi:hypothetical protein